MTSSREGEIADEPPSRTPPRPPLMDYEDLGPAMSHAGLQDAQGSLADRLGAVERAQSVLSQEVRALQALIMRLSARIAELQGDPR